MYKVPDFEDGTPEVNLSFPKQAKSNNKINKKLLEAPKLKGVIKPKLKAENHLKQHFDLISEKQKALKNNDVKPKDIKTNGDNKIIPNVINKKHSPKRAKVAKKQKIIVEAKSSIESVEDNKKADKLYDTDKLDELILNEKKQKLNSYKKDDVEEILFNDNSENLKIKNPKVENNESDRIIHETRGEKKNGLKSIKQKRNNSETKKLYQLENKTSKPKDIKKNKVQKSILLQNGNKNNLEDKKTKELHQLESQILERNVEKKKKDKKSITLQNGNKDDLENEKAEERSLKNQIVKNKDERKKKVQKSILQIANKNNHENKISKEINPTSAVNKIIKIKDGKKKEAFKRILLSHRNSIKVSGDKLRERMLERLKAAQFRYLNEKLYTSSGSDAKQLFQEDPEAFQTYHEGYQQQVKRWPVKPLEVIVKRIQKMPKTHTIADMGCGEAELSTSVVQPVRSFDLVASKPAVETCDMAHTPLLSSSMDVAVYCLALMGTDLTQYLVEANRVLKVGGHLLIAEVESRFHDVDSFTRDIQKLGFTLKKIDKSQKVFFFMEFTKVRDPPVKKAKLPVLSLKPCIYKKR